MSHNKNNNSDSVLELSPIVVIFGFFVENHLLANKKSSFHDLWFESYNHCRQQALFFSLFSVSLLKITNSSFHNLWF